MEKRKLKTFAKRSVAVVSSASLLVSCGMTGMFTAYAASDGDATKMYIYDSCGNLLSGSSVDTAVVYIDNSTKANDGSDYYAEDYVTVEIVNEDHELTDSLAPPAYEGKNNTYFQAWLSNYERTEHRESYRVNFRGYYEQEVETTDPLTGEPTVQIQQIPYQPGIVNIPFTSMSGSVSDNMTVVVQEPATDIMISYGGSQLKLNDYSMYNTGSGMLLTANHQYKFDGSIVTAHPGTTPATTLDTIEWRVYDGFLSGEDGLTLEDLDALPAAKNAKITQEGFLTTLQYGQATIVAVIKDTEKAQRDYDRRLRAYRSKLPDYELAVSIYNDKYAEYEAALAEYNEQYDNGNAENAPEPPTPPVAPEPLEAPSYIPDRLPVQGVKTRTVYLPVIEPETYKVVTENGRIKYQEDDKGNLITGTLSMDTKPLRAHYRTNAAGVVYADPILEYGKPVYVKNLNTPKFINLIIRRDNPATKIEFTNAPDTMTIGENRTLELNKTPTHNVHEEGYEAGATDEIFWSSSNEEVATVDQNGIVTAISKGDVEIKAKGDNISASHHITVRAKAKSITLDPRSTTTRVGTPVEISAILDPVEANEQVQWISEDENVAIVEAEDSNGELTNVQKALVTGVTVGETNIKAVIPNANDPDSSISVNCLVEVQAKNLSSDIILSTPMGKDIKYLEDNNVLDLFTNQEITINARLKSENGEVADDKVKWSILGNDSFVTTVEETTEKLTLRGIAEGTVTIVASAEADDTINKVFKIKVLKRCENMIVTDYGTKTAAAGKNLNVGSSVQFGAYMTVSGSRPEAHSDYISSWESSDPEVAEVEYIYNDVNKIIGCTVTAKKIGSATITATSASGAAASVGIFVFTTTSVDIGEVTLDTETNKLMKSMTLNNDFEGQLAMNAIVKDQNNNQVYGASVTWTSSNPEVAEIDNNGLVTAHDIGTTELTLISGGKTESCTLTVYAPITSIKDVEIPAITYTPRLTTFVPENLTFKAGGHTLTEGKDYDIEYTNNTNVGIAYATLTGKGYFTDTAVYTYQINQKNLSDNDVFIQYATRQECTGLEIIPEIKVFYDGIQLKANEDYYTYLANNTLPGTATITLVGGGCYAGEVTKKFEIFCDHKNLVDATIVKRATYEENGLEVGRCAACGEENVHNIIPKYVHSANPALTLAFGRSEYGLFPNETMTLVPIATTKDMSIPATDIFRWESDDPTIVSVSDTGEIRGINAGKTTITVYGESEHVEASCVVAVLEKTTSLTVTPNPIETRVGVSVELRAEVEPYYTNDEIVWESENTSIATVVPSEGDPLSAVVTGQSVGKTVITARARYSDITYRMDVNVGARNASDIIAISTKIGETPIQIPNSTDSTEYTYRIYTNQDVTFTAAITNNAGKASDDVVVWRVSDNEGDTITLPNDDITKEIIGSELSVHAASLGSCTITAYPQTNPELKTHFKLEVAKRCDYVTIYNEKDEVFTGRALNVGDHVKVHAILTTVDPNHPFDHGDDVRSWESSDPTVAEVDNTGYITAKKNGAATVTVTTRSGRIATCEISVFTTSSVYFMDGVAKPEKDGDLPTATITVDTQLNGTRYIAAAIYDQNENPVYGAFCTWTSSNEAVATVDEYGTITAHSVGTAIITARSGAKDEKCLLTVYAPVAAMTVENLEDFVYTPTQKSYTPTPIIKVGENTLVEGTDYTIAFENNETVGIANMIVTGLGLYVDTASRTFEIKARPLNDALVTVEPIADQEYTGNYITPKITVRCDGVELVQDSDYALVFENNVEEGKATVTITPVWGSPYSESRTMEFNIVRTIIGTMGDVNSDTVIDSNDALKVLRASVGMDTLTDEEAILADVSGDGTVTSDDSLMILRYGNGLDAPGAKIDVPASKNG